TPWSARMWLAVTTSAIAWALGSRGFLAGAGWAGTVAGANAIRASAAAAGKTRERWVMGASLERRVAPNVCESGGRAQQVLQGAAGAGRRLAYSRRAMAQRWKHRP